MSTEQLANQESLLDNRVVDIRRTTKVVKGGRVFSFSATVVVGDKHGRVGYAHRKAKEVTIAIQKATDGARRNMKRIALNHKMTLQHPITVECGSTKVVMKPASEGSGIIAGGATRDVFEVLGISNVSAKIIGSSNPNNVIQATIQGLLGMTSPEQVAEKRGKTVAEIIG